MNPKDIKLPFDPCFCRWRVGYMVRFEFVNNFNWVWGKAKCSGTQGEAKQSWSQLPFLTTYDQWQSPVCHEVQVLFALMDVYWQESRNSEYFAKMKVEWLIDKTKRIWKVVHWLSFLLKTVWYSRKPVDVLWSDHVRWIPVPSAWKIRWHHFDFALARMAMFVIVGNSSSKLSPQLHSTVLFIQDLSLKGLVDDEQIAPWCE